MVRSRGTRAVAGLALVSVLAAAASTGCGRPGPTSSPTTRVASREALTRGGPVDGESSGVLRVLADVECSGFLITNDWAMTARHCVSSQLARTPDAIQVAFGGTRTSPEQVTTVAEVVRSAPGPDLALLKLSAALNVAGMTAGFQQRVYPALSNSVLKKSLDCVGWGATGLRDPPADQPTEVSLLLDQITPPLLIFPASDLGQQVARGDAGGTCFSPSFPNLPVGVMAGIDSMGYGVAIDLTQTATRTWVESTLLARDTDIPASAVSIPAAVWSARSGIDLFWIDANGAMNGSPVAGDRNPVLLGNPAGDPFTADRPAAIYLGSQVHVLGKTRSGGVFEIVLDDLTATTAWTRVPNLARVNSGLGVASWGPNRLDLFARTDAALAIHAWSADGAWVGSEVIGGTSDTDILAAAVLVGYLAVYTVQGNHLLQKRGDERSWDPPTAEWDRGDYLNGTVSSACAVVTPRGDQIDLYGRGSNGHLVHKQYASGWVNGFLDLGMDIPGEPTVVLAGSREHLFARNADGTLWHAHLPR